jgi:hypothetical protein
MAVKECIKCGSSFYRVNMDKLDNRTENLQVMDRGDHTRLHKRMKKC